MFRIPLVLLVCVVVGRPGLAQPAKETAKQQPPATTPQPARYELTVSANPAPAPRLQLTLLPTWRDRSPGNAALGYLRAITLLPPWPRDPDASKKLGEQLIHWEECPLDQLPVKEVGNYLKAHRSSFRAVDEAARMTGIDWQQRGEAAEEIGATVEGIQGFRELARFLKLRYRWELADNRPRDALRTIQTLMQLGKHVAEGHNMIQMLVGLAILRIGLDGVQAWIQHPDAANLYWALATLPRPLVDPRPALDGEARLSLSFVPGLKRLEAGPISETEANKALQDTFKLMSASIAEGNISALDSLKSAFGVAALTLRQAPSARQDLVAWGWPTKTVDEMPPAQVVLLRATAWHRRHWDEQVSMFYLPYPKVAVQLGGFSQRLNNSLKFTDNDPIVKVFSLVFPAAAKCHEAFVRTDRLLNELTALEALRLQAAANNNQWPTTLAEVGVVQVPNDPLTGQPFSYRAQEQQMILFAPPPVGETTNPANAQEFIVNLRR